VKLALHFLNVILIVLIVKTLKMYNKVFLYTSKERIRILIRTLEN